MAENKQNSGIDIESTPLSDMEGNTATTERAQQISYDIAKKTLLNSLKVQQTSRQKYPELYQKNITTAYGAIARTMTPKLGTDKNMWNKLFTDPDVKKALQDAGMKPDPFLKLVDTPGVILKNPTGGYKYDPAKGTNFFENFFKGGR